MKRQRALKEALCRGDLRERQKKKRERKERRRKNVALFFCTFSKSRSLDPAERTAETYPCVLIRKDVFTRHALIEVFHPRSSETEFPPRLRQRRSADIFDARYASNRASLGYEKFHAEIPRRNTPRPGNKFRGRDYLENESTRIYESSEKIDDLGPRLAFTRN